MDAEKIKCLIESFVHPSNLAFFLQLGQKSESNLNFSVQTSRLKRNQFWKVCLLRIGLTSVAHKNSSDNRSTIRQMNRPTFLWINFLLKQAPTANQDVSISVDARPRSISQEDHLTDLGRLDDERYLLGSTKLWWEKFLLVLRWWWNFSFVWSFCTLCNKFSARPG